MKNKQYFITMLLISFYMLSNISCNNQETYVKNEAYIKNEALEKQIEVFIKDAKSYVPSYKEEAEKITLRFEKRNNYFLVYFDYILFTDNPNLYTIIETKNRTVFIISDIDISKFIYTNKPYKASDYRYKSNKKPIGEEIDWYRDFQYFDGQTFSRKESDMKN